uniref:4-alpha-glucanotransferase n=1 Tax=Candidatus Kentrum eta TaxID=2126337 RepID=A0A450UHK2_9GAMM|nr:MAG: 4-alpha-glucanotransferase [Candidatus Kentron sp. H]VFJ92300.1 MAG: 4-alpha-glucanotransferase [Candidatus Kentron sp. H]VFK01427.1 MAG: 4-alpha-glucanotransferase [Candidatus Kentron sp. H]
MKPIQNTSSPLSSILDKRQAGILLHPTSLPGGAGSGHGDLGKNAYRFVDFLEAGGFSVWQTLPLGPTGAYHNPYSSPSVNGGNTRLISLDKLIERGWLRSAANPDSAGNAAAPQKNAFTPEAFGWHKRCLSEARAGFLKKATGEERDGYEAFLAEQGYWLDDYSLFEALRQTHKDIPWQQWPVALRDRESLAMEEVREELLDAIQQIRFEQFLFFRQWFDLKEYANKQGIALFGDMPIFVDLNSDSVWAHRHYFRLDKQGRPTVVTGVPPDYFSETGQLWGNPHYDWERMRQDDFLWWRNRFQGHLQLFDILRIDHFRGFEAHWEVSAKDKTAMNGRWVEAPGMELFTVLRKKFPALPLVAEDLGVITPEVDALRDHFGLPGMKVLQFGFDGNSDNPHVPHRHTANSVVYAGTHDNDTTLGWFKTLPDAERARVRRYLNVHEKNFPKALIRAALASVGNLAILTMQDILGLGSEGRMNLPGVAKGHWQWRFSWEQVPDGIETDLRDLVALYGR